MPDRSEHVAKIRATTERWLRQHKPEIDIAQACFYHAVIGSAHFHDHGVVAGIAAGSASWPRIDLAQDDGVMATHFSYMFEQSPQTVAALLENRMPEMHVWIYLPDTKEIVDVTTRYLKQQCERSAGMQWLGPEPPDYIWATVDELPPGVVYETDKVAVQIARQYVAQTWAKPLDNY